MKNSLKLLVVGDVHYTGRAKLSSPIPQRKTEYGLEFLKRVFRRIREDNRPDAIVLIGDMVNDGLTEGAANDLSEIKKAVESTGIKTIFLPGNHDADYALFFSAMNDRPGSHLVKNFILYSFADTYGEGDACVRKEEDLRKFRTAVKKHPEKRVIVLQHNPVYPPIESAYPYNLINAEDVHKTYAGNRVILSLSGHYHPGQDLTFRDGVGYLTVPGICEEPFGYALVDIQEEEINLHSYRLKSSVPLFDNHCHSQFAYCAEDVTIKEVIKRASLLGLNYVCFTEHAPHLYLTKEEYWGKKFFYNPGLIHKATKRGINRMSAFRQSVADSNSPLAKIGLEVEPDIEGGITLLPEDRAGLDLINGAIHVLSDDILSAPIEKLHSGFMKAVESLMVNKVDVLAHPFRFFYKGRLPAPKGLYRPMAKMLKGYGVAAELNFHTNRPDPEFFSVCLEEGVKISLGSDTHNLLEAGEFSQHLTMLKKIGVSEDNLGRILYVLPRNK